MITPTDDSSRLNAIPLMPFFEGDHLAGHHSGEAVNPRDAVADLEHLPDLGPGDLGRGTARSHAG